MKKVNKMKKWIMFGLLSSAFSLALIGGTAHVAKADVVPTITLNDNLEATYDYGEEIVLPEGSVSIGGQKYVADCVLYRPDGTATNASEVTLDCTGEYVLEYTVNVSGTYVTQKKTFVVTNESLSVDGKGYVSYTEFNGVYGAKVQMQDGDILKYNQVINLNRFADTDELFRLFALPQQLGQEECGRFEVLIQDIHDENRVIVLEIKQAPFTNRKTVSYTNAKYGDGVYVGLHPTDKKGAIEFEGKQYDWALSGLYGAPIEECSFAGTPSKVALGEEWIGVCYGAENNVIRVKNQTKVISVADMDNPAFFKETFPGFTTGEVRISIKPTNFARSTATFFVTHFAGKTIAENTYYADNKAPELKVDLKGYTETELPNALIGKPYKLFNASAFDINDGEVKTECNVYFGYNNQHRVNVKLQGDTFVPLYKGIYTLEYTAKDKAGNVSKQLLRVKSTERTGALSLSLTGFEENFIAGNKQCVIDGYGVNNALGHVKLYAVATLRDDPAVQYVLDEDYAFTPLYAGTYDVEFRYSDYHETKSEQKVITVAQSDVVLFETDGLFPKYLLKNGTYEFPVMQAIDLSSGVPVSFPTKLYIIEDNKAEVEWTSSYKISASNEVTLRYRYSNAKYHDVPIPTVDAGFGGVLRLADYFVATKGSFASSSDMNGVYFTLTEVQDGAALQFVNKLNPSVFNFDMRVDAASWRTGAKISLYLQEDANENNVLKFTYALKKNGVYVSVNDVKEQFLCAFAEEVNLKAAYSAYNGKVSFNGILTIPVSTNLQGRDFVGFGKGAMLTVSFEEGFTGGERVAFVNVNGQTLSNVTSDGIQAVLLHENGSYGERKLNDIVEILPCYAYDALTPDVMAYVSVIGPDRQYVQDLDGTLLKNVRADVLRKVQLTQYGDYVFQIEAKDASGEATRYPFRAFVIKDEAPKVEISSAKLQGKVDTAVSLKNYTISGVSDLSKSTVYVTVKKPNGVMEYVNNPSAYTAKEKGTYIVRVAVLDEYGNLGEATFILVIS